MVSFLHSLLYTSHCILTRSRHKADFDSLRANPEAIKLKRDEKILNHDAEVHAYNNYDSVIAELRKEGKI